MTTSQPARDGTLDISDPLRSYALIATVVTLLASPLLALSYFATKDGAEYLDDSTVGAWAEPAREIVLPLVTFANPDRVYALYSLIFVVALPILPIAAWTVRRWRLSTSAEVGRGERIVSMVVTVAWACFTLGLGIAVIALQFDPAHADGSSVTNIAFLSLMLPGMLIALLASTGLGFIWLRKGVKPRLGAVLLMLALPLWILGSLVMGHNSLGITPQVVAWALLIWPIGTPSRQPSSVSVS